MKSKHLFVIFFVVFVACKTKEKQDNLQVQVAPQDTVKVVEAPVISPPPIEKIDMGVNLDDRYFLVVDSYTVKEFADSWNKIYQQRGFNSAVIMRNEDGYYRLALQSFKEFNLAEKALADLRKDEEYQKVWIMVIKR